MRKLLLAFLLLISSSALAAPAFVQKSTGTNIAGAVAVTSGSITTTAGNTLIVVISDLIGTGGNPPTASCSGQGATWVKIVDGVTSTSGAAGALHVFYAVNIPGATGGVTCTTVTGTGSWMSILLMEYSGLDTTAPLVTNTYVGTDVSTSGQVSCGTVNPQWDSELIIGGFATGSTVSVPTTAPGYTTRAGVTNGSNVRNEAEELIISNNLQPQTATWTINVAEDYRCGTYEWKAAGAKLLQQPQRRGGVVSQ
jgi:hypothetical protein